ncbi:MAG: ABC transporter permease [Candidatus Saccharimonadales bacterium]
MNIFSRGIRNAFRNSIRTFSIVIILGLSIGLSLTMLIAHQAVGDKITSVKANVGNTVSISPAGVRGFEGGGNPLTEANLASVQNLPHVVSNVATLSDRLTTSNTSLQSSITPGSLGKRFAQNNGTSFSGPGGGGEISVGGGGGTFNFTPPVQVTGTTSPTSLNQGSAASGGKFTLTSGSVFSGNSSANEAIIGTAIASKNNLKVGSTFTAYGTTIKVVGIFSTGNTFGDSQVIMPLKTVQTLSSQSGDLSSIILNVDSITNVDSVTSEATKVLGSAADVTNASTQAQSVISPLESIQNISLYSLIGAVIAGSIIILLTMIMIVRERRREIGVLKAIGGSNVVVMGQFMIEAVTFTALAAVIGIGLGVVAGNPITKLLVTNSSQTATPGFGGGGGRGFGIIRNNFSSIHAAIGWDIILYGLLAALVIALVGSGLASFVIAKIRPAEVMRVE